MNHDDLAAALAEADRIKKLSEYYAIDGSSLHIVTLAAAFRELRETVERRDRLISDWKDAYIEMREDRNAWEAKVRKANALARLQARAAVNPSLDTALNEGDGTFKP